MTEDTYTDQYVWTLYRDRLRYHCSICESNGHKFETNNKRVLHDHKTSEHAY